MLLFTLSYKINFFSLFILLLIDNSMLTPSPSSISSRASFPQYKAATFSGFTFTPVLISKVLTKYVVKVEVAKSNKAGAAVNSDSMKLQESAFLKEIFFLFTNFFLILSTTLLLLTNNFNLILDIISCKGFTSLLLVSDCMFSLSDSESEFKVLGKSVRKGGVG